MQRPSNQKTQKGNRPLKEVEFYEKVQQRHLGRAFTKGRLYSIAVPSYAESSEGRLRILNK